MKLIRKYMVLYNREGCVWEYNGSYYHINHRARSSVVHIEMGSCVHDIEGEPYIPFVCYGFHKYVRGNRRDFRRMIRNPEATFAEHIL